MTIGRRRVVAASTCGGEDGLAGDLTVAGKFDDQNRILTGQTNQYHEADLREDVDVHGRGPRRP